METWFLRAMEDMEHKDTVVAQFVENHMALVDKAPNSDVYFRTPAAKLWLFYQYLEKRLNSPKIRNRLGTTNSSLAVFVDAL